MHNYNFNLLRNLLSLLVVFTHWNILTSNYYSHPIFNLSGFAVDSFFVVSGLLVWLSFKYTNNIKYFFIKRFFRLFPLYFIVILLQLLFFTILYYEFTFNHFEYFVYNVLFLNFLSPSIGNVFINSEVDAINGSLWTLKHEVLFYLLVPLLYKFSKDIKNFLIYLFIFSCLYIFTVEYFNIVFLKNQFPAYLRLFVSGVFLSLLFQKEDLMNRLQLNALNLFIFLALSFVLYLFYNDFLFRTILYPFLITLFLLFFISFFGTFKFNFDFSYSLYIIHFPILQIILYFDLFTNFGFFNFCIFLIFCLSLSYFIFLPIENFFITYGKNLIKTLRGSSYA